MNIYRSTRNQPYANPNCLGRTDLEARQGYYVTAESEADAIALMQEHFPDNTDGFTARALGIAVMLKELRKRNRLLC